MAGRWDVAVIGAGHNGLIAAAYLARAGRSVLVLERAEAAGGTVGSDEIAPGFTAPSTFASAERLHAAVVKELRLASHGLELLAPAGSVVVGPGGDALRFDGNGRLVDGRGGGGTAAGNGALSAADREALAAFERLIDRIAGVLEPLYGKPLPELEALHAADKADLLRVGWRLRRLGRRDMREAMRLLPMAIRDVAEERFASPTLQAAVGGLGIEGAWLGPYSVGTAFNLVHHRIGARGGMFSGPVFVRGGMGKLAAALRGAAEAAGAEVRTGVEVTGVVGDAGRVRGVRLAGGDHLDCSLVVSDADPRHTLLDLVDPAALSAGTAWAAANIRARGGAAVVSFALDGIPAGGETAELLRGSLQLGGGLADQERAFDAGQRGQVPERPFVRLTVPSLHDPGLAPEGKHVASAWVQTVPYDLDGAGGREALSAAVLAVIEEALPGFGARVLARRITAPADIAARFGAAGGCLYDVDISLDQALFLRPMAGWYRYRTPLGGLYLCGSGTHGGGGVSGLAGRNAATQVLADLKAGRAV